MCLHMRDLPAKLYWISKNENENKKKQKRLIVRKDKKRNSNLLFHSDNIDAMDYLFKHGFSERIDLIYIDPPFWSGEKYFHRIKNVQNVAFEDVWKHQINSYLDMIYPRLCAIQKLISRSGSIFIHLDWHIVHYVKIIMDEIFGHENFRNEILVKRGRRKNLLYQFHSIDRMHSANDTILWYSKSASTKFSHPLAKYTSNSKWMGFWSNVNRPTMRYDIFGIVPERGQWKWCKSRALKAIENYKLYKERFSSIPLEQYWIQTNKELEFIRKREGIKYAEYWIPPKTHRVLDNVWMDIETYNYSTGYDTEKHTELLERIIGQFSKVGDLVADFFCGSGTTLLVAQKLARKWIGCDSSLSAMEVTKRRLEDSKFSLINITSL
jgi:adenine-specific DNA-methyltransferase